MSRFTGYKNLFPEVNVCIYCGFPAEVKDHILPYSHRDNPLAVSKVYAPACAECNGLLLDSLQHKVKDRIAEAKRRLTKKYKKVLSSPNWTIEELSEMSHEFQVRIIKTEYDKKIIKERIQFDFFLWEQIGKPVSLLPGFTDLFRTVR